MMKPYAVTLLVFGCLMPLLGAFGPLHDMRWSGHGDTPEVQARFQALDTGIRVDFQSSPVNGCWVKGELAGRRATEGFLTFRGRSTDGMIRAAAVHVNLIQPDGKHAGFLSYFEFSPEWREYNMDLRQRTLSRQEAHQGKFIFTGGDAGAIDLGDGEIESVMFSSSVPGGVEVDRLAIAAYPSDRAAQEAAVAAIEQSIAEHQVVAPYRFAQTGDRNFELARDGKSRWVIEIADSENPAYAFAAAELARYIRRATEADLPITGSIPGTPAIALRIADPEQADDGFAMTGSANGIVITANNSRSLLFAVYDFLEKSLAIRFFAPYDFAEVVPETPVWTLSDFSDREQAAYSYRRFHYCSSGKITPQERLFTVADWNVKNRFNVQLERLYWMGDTPEIQQQKQQKIEEFYRPRGGRIGYVEYWGHNYHLFVPPERYFATHPEYFPYERATGRRRAEQAQLCTTNPEVIRIIAEQALAYFRATPDAEFFPLFQEDGTTLWCQCDPCLAIVAPHRRDTTGYDADRVIYLANAVADAVQSEFPGKKIVTYAYSTSVTPPDTVMPNEHVYIEYCVYGDGNPTTPAYRNSDRGNIERWRQLTNGRMIVYSYHALGFTYQFRDPATMAADFRYFSDIGLRGSCQETAETWGMDGFLYYVSARLAWNPWLDLESLEADYFAGLYGMAAEPMRNFHRLLTGVLADSKRYVFIQFARKPLLTDDEMTRLETYQRQAEELAPSPQVEFHRKTLRYIQAVNRMVATARRCQEEPNAIHQAAAEKACDAAAELIREQAADWVVTIYDLGSVEHMRSMIQMIMENAEGQQALQHDHTIVATLSDHWRFQTDGSATGEAAGWFAANFADGDWASIRTGAFWEDQGFAGFDGVGWYRRVIDIPADTNGLRLYFGGADERAWVYLDGEWIGAHEAGDIGELWQEPFYIDLPSDITPGAHQLTVKVIDTAGGGGLWKEVLLVRRKSVDQGAK